LSQYASSKVNTVVNIAQASAKATAPTRCM
jgi:hypothetical protein